VLAIGPEAVVAPTPTPLIGDSGKCHTQTTELKSVTPFYTTEASLRVSLRYSLGVYVGHGNVTA